MSRLIDELRSLTPVQVDTSVTTDELQEIITILETRARTAAQHNQKSVGLCLDEFKRKGGLAKTKIPRKPLPALEQHFRDQGVAVRFCDDMSCGFCNMRDCDTNAHYGYILEWDFETTK